jgi:hypothetical protein
MTHEEHLYRAVARYLKNHSKKTLRLVEHDLDILWDAWNDAKCAHLPCERTVKTTPHLALLGTLMWELMVLAIAFTAIGFANPPKVQSSAQPTFFEREDSMTANPTTVWPIASDTAGAWPAQMYYEAPTPIPLPTVRDAQEYARKVLGPVQYGCLFWIINGESQWDPYQWNVKGSGAYGLGQAKPPDKMAEAGSDYMENPVTQVKWVIQYVNHRYGSACGAYQFRAQKGWF